MKKAFIDQILLGFFLFVMLVIIGATIADITETRDKYYNLKKITDNGAYTLAKYYEDLDANTTVSEAAHQAMLAKTKLGNEVKNTIQYTWDFTSNPNTVTVTIPNYVQDTFWFRFLGTNTFNLHAESQANINITSTGNLMPFAVNGCNEGDDTNNILDVGDTYVFDLQGYTGYEYPGDSEGSIDYNYTEFYGITKDECPSDPAGNSNWSHFKDGIKDYSVEDGTIENNDPLLDASTGSAFCIPQVSDSNDSTQEKNNDPTQIKNSFNQLDNTYDLVGAIGYLAVLDCGSTPDNLIIKKFIKVKFHENPTDSYQNTGNPGNDEYDIFQFNVEILSGVELNY